MYQVYLAGVIGNSTYKAEWREYVCKQCQLQYGTDIALRNPMRFKQHLDGIEKLDFVYNNQFL